MKNENARVYPASREREKERERERERERKKEERERERERNFLSVSRKKLGDVAKLIKGDGKLKGIDKLKILVNFLESNRCFSISSNDNNNLFFFICNHLFNLSSSKRETFLYKYKVFEAPFFEDYSLKE